MAMKSTFVSLNTNKVNINELVDRIIIPQVLVKS